MEDLMKTREFNDKAKADSFAEKHQPSRVLPRLKGEYGSQEMVWVVNYDMKNVLRFTTELKKENSHSAWSIGVHKCEMIFFAGPDQDSPGDFYGSINWETDELDKDGNETGDGESVGIGLWFDRRKRLTDYDGVFELPKEAIKLIRKCGYTVPRDFE